jgi:hypothetical protein
MIKNVPIARSGDVARAVTLIAEGVIGWKKAVNQGTPARGGSTIPAAIRQQRHAYPARA